MPKKKLTAAEKEKERRKLLRKQQTQIKRIEKIIKGMEKNGYIFSKTKLSKILKLSSTNAELKVMQKRLDMLKGTTKRDLYGRVKSFQAINYETGEGKLIRGNEEAVKAGKKAERAIWQRKKTTRKEQADFNIGIITGADILHYREGKYVGSRYTTGEKANVQGAKDLIAQTYMSLRDELTKPQLEKISKIVTDAEWYDSDQEETFLKDMDQIYQIMTDKTMPSEYQYDPMQPVSTPAEDIDWGAFL